ncbi:archease protein family (MTH1598/TM1083) [Micromonospora olivasterospora]|uniref:Archease protein family (MTH1598/TM1083) n=1 Tax=Micromonospora olivasterospora TaxID=1880 RepID=A0A562IHB8_MICOL|nr:archease [Micromonospora olivasterospora]TWH70340.1 archease protein family (MTH1598/TM1083) [Micromonospora olivasterospora]
MERGPGRGHRAVPHTADVRIEAWAPDREGCLAEAVRAAVETFADFSGAGPGTGATVDVPAGDDEDLLVGALDEMIFRLETEGTLPVAVEVTARPDGACGCAGGSWTPTRWSRSARCRRRCPCTSCVSARTGAAGPAR